MRAKAERASAARAKERAGHSFFIFVMFFAVFGLIVLTELVLLEREPAAPRASVDDIQAWGSRTESERISETPPAPPRVPDDGRWQPVGGTRYKFFVFSAWVERRTTAAVRVVGATRTRGFEHVWCRLWLAGNRTLAVRARLKPIRENWNLKFSACFVLCPLRDAGVGVDELGGATVAVINSEHGEPSNLMRVQETRTDRAQGLAACVKPFHFAYERPLWLLEWLELHALLGVRALTMYEQSLGARSACVLRAYRDAGAVTLLPWHLDLVSKIDIRNQGQFAAFNDCLYRAMARSEWLFVLDVDEVVVPRRERTLGALLGALSGARPAAAFLFRNAFFYTRWPDDPSAADALLLTQRKTRRWLVPHAVKNRSKYAVRPSRALELGNHFVWEFVPGGTAAAVSPERALLHHYRQACEFGGDDCLKVSSVADRSAHRFGAELERRVRAQHSLLAESCDLPPLPAAANSTSRLDR